MAAICGVCGLPDELCICQEIANNEQSYPPTEGDTEKS